MLARSVRLLVLAGALSSVSCGPRPRHLVQSVVPLHGEELGFAVQWDSSELRHPRIDLWVFDGRSLVPQFGMTTSFVRRSMMIAATQTPSHTLVHREGEDTLFATGPDGYVLAPALALRDLAPLGDGLAGTFVRSSPPPSVTVLQALDERGRERWQAEQPAGMSLCPRRSLVTPDRFRAVLLLGDPATGCHGTLTLRAYAPDGRLVRERTFAPIAAGSTEGVTMRSSSARDDLTIGVVATFGANEEHGALFFLRPDDAEASRVELGRFAPSHIAPVGAALWLIVGTRAERMLRGQPPNAYEVSERYQEAWLVDERGERRYSARLRRSSWSPLALTVSPRGAALFAATDTSDRPRWLSFAPDGRVLLDATLDLEARAMMVQSPLASEP